MTAEHQQSAMPPRLAQLATRVPDRFPETSPSMSLRPAAVLVLLWQHEDEICTMLTRRVGTLRAHAGEISFPGGICCPDESEVDAALREAIEEVALDPSRVEVCGFLDQVWTGAGTVVTPVVAWHAAGRPEVVPSPSEVDEVLVATVRSPSRQLETWQKEVVVVDRTYADNFVRFDDFTAKGPTADIVLDIVAWLSGSDPRHLGRRLDDLTHFAKVREWF